MIKSYLTVAFALLAHPALANTPSTYGAACDAVMVSSATAITAGTPNLSVAGASFTAFDVGKIISVPQAGATVGSVHGTLNTTIVGFTDSRHVTLAANAATTVASVEAVVYGTDDSTALAAAFNGGGQLGLTTISGCIYSRTITQTVPNRVTGLRGKSTLFYRQLSGAVSTRAITLAPGSGGSSYLDFVVNADVGGQIMSPNNAATIFVADGAMTFDGMEINANSSGQVQNSVGGISDRDSIADTLLLSDIFLRNNVIHDIGAYAMFWGAVNNLHIEGNRFYNVGPFTAWSGVVRVSSFGTAASGTNLQLLNNFCDETNQTITTANECFILAGSTTANWLGATVSGNQANGVAGAINFGVGLGYNLNYVSNIIVDGNTCIGHWECIGTGNVMDGIVSNNVSTGAAVACIESNTDLRMSFTGNYCDMGPTGSVGLLIGETFPLSVTGNTVWGALTGIFYYLGPTYCCSSVGVSITGNTIRMSGGSSSPGIRVSAISPSAIFNVSITGNNIYSDGTTGSIGVKLNSEVAGAFISGAVVGPNMISGPATGVAVLQPISDFCYVPGGNFAATPTSIAGSVACH